jgi:catalase
MAELVSTDLGEIKVPGSKPIKIDKSFLITSSVMYDGVYVPGGAKSVERLKSNGDALHFVSEAFKHCKPIAASGEGISLLEASGIKGIALAGTGKKQDVVADQGVITASGTDKVTRLGEEFVKALTMHRFWEREKKDQTAA